jgi:hypothetical protein
MILDWVSFLAYPNLFGLKAFVFVVVVVVDFTYLNGASRSSFVLSVLPYLAIFVYTDPLSMKYFQKAI